MKQMAQTRIHIGPVQLGIIVCTLATALIHLYEAVQPGEDLRNWFILNCIGYLVLLVAWFLPQLAGFHRLVRYVLILYTAITVLMWFLIGLPSEPIGYVTKAIEVLLIIFLATEDVQERRHSLSYSAS
ncbi:hypothetical protein [Dictyobacter aurantiacus]|uniref:Uncharacterized protein n=1 Tax=Dictyobacter aurantiacus TaxID=1936993 RepID=A0A401ZPH0_9CHLR|nr:hypothetical protein [Dictyobacter aurantiacus]GCE08767.1 hypothetical protein KDAU_60960 [Dictyobacter aurantiacus]